MIPTNSSATKYAFPRLWCPLLTHYRPDGTLDADRMRAHLGHILPYVNAFLVPGSTGDGWLMDDTESRSVLELVLDLLNDLPGGEEATVIVGALKPQTDDVIRFITRINAYLMERDDRERVAGFAVCPPTGAAITPEAMEADLRRVLALGLPTALYQLPQVTQNRMSPKLIARLAAEFENFVLFKDSSGEDIVARSGRDLGRVFLVRGAEGDYGRWLKESGGPYDGFLLSTANVFASELRTIVNAADAPSPETTSLAETVSACVAAAFAAVSGLSVPGNAFTHANKALDHYQAFGPDAPLDADALPLLYGGVRMPRASVLAVGDALRHANRMPVCGYLSGK